MSLGRPKRWLVTEEDREAVARIQKALGCSSLLARLLVNRGVREPEEADAFLHPTFSHLSDPLLLPDAGKAVERLKQALHRKEKIAIHGDYDCDGVTSAALWTRLLERLGGNVVAHVPHRHRDGYDMRAKFVEQAKAEGVDLILTTDCGTRRIEEVEAAREAGIDVIVTDHHELGEQLPNAVAVVNPHRRDSQYPFKDLAGVGVAFRLGEALLRHLGMPTGNYLRAYSDLCAIGTVADIMPLLGENRIFVKYGLEALQNTQKPGLRALMNAAGIQNRPLSASNIGWVIGPRLNAVGRVDDSRYALDLLLTRDSRSAATLAARLEQANAERKEEQARITDEAVQMASEYDLDETFCLVLSSTDWHAGVVGIVASKIVERFQRPTILISLNPETGEGRGSARSLNDFDIFSAILECKHRLQEYGGHAHAAGFSIKEAEVQAFAEEMNEAVRRRIRPEHLQPRVRVDAEIDAARITPKMLCELDLLQPFGHDNPEPVFVSRGLELEKIMRIGRDQNHLKLVVTARDLPPTEAVMWHGGPWAERLEIGHRLDLCYRPQLNTFNGRTSIQFMLLDMRLSGIEE